MPTLVELATQIVTAQATSSALSTDDIVLSLTRIHTTLGQLETGVVSLVKDATAPAAKAGKPAIDVDKAFRKNEVVCLLCGKSFKTLGWHLASSHGMSTAEYRKEFGIPKNQPLVCKTHSETVKEIHARLATGRRGKMAETAPEAVEDAGDTTPVEALSDIAASPEADGVEVKVRRKPGRPRKKKFEDYIVEV